MHSPTKPSNQQQANVLLEINSGTIISKDLKAAVKSACVVSSPNWFEMTEVLTWPAFCPLQQLGWGERAGPCQPASSRRQPNFLVEMSSKGFLLASFGLHTQLLLSTSESLAYSAVAVFGGTPTWAPALFIFESKHQVKEPSTYCLGS